MPSVPAPVERALDRALDRALAVQRPAVMAYLDRARRARPDATPAELVALLERRYRAAVIGTGAAAGGVAALPGAGTAASVAAGAAEITSFVSATALFVLAVAEVFGVPTADPQVRRALVLTVLLGDVGAAALDGIAVEPRHWVAALGRSGSKDTVHAINARLAPLLIARFGARQGALVAGRALPFGVGAGVGAAGNAALARGVIRTARRVFGPAPERFEAHVLDGRTPRRRRFRRRDG